MGASCDAQSDKKKSPMHKRGFLSSHDLLIQSWLHNICGDGMSNVAILKHLSRAATYLHFLVFIGQRVLCASQNAHDHRRNFSKSSRGGLHKRRGQRVSEMRLPLVVVIDVATV